MSAIEPRNAGPPAQVFLLPGTLHCSAEHAIIATILGSCVAVCLWDCVRGNGGMNHFLLWAPS
jgi:chemotaxis receptor (MCP) glutamine deamidase CheD